MAFLEGESQMFDDLLKRFGPIEEKFLASRPVQAVLRGEMTPDEYRSILREVFHHTRENPQLQATAATFFRGRDREMVRSFYAHAASEIGHDQLALNDFTSLGGDPTAVPYENPLPATSALLAYGFYQIFNLNPVGYLGYLFFLEFTPTRSGGMLMGALETTGIPRAAMTFLNDHTEIDVGHNRMMEKYAASLIHDEGDLDAVEYAMLTTSKLYERMLTDAMDDVKVPCARGWNWEELRADGRTPAEFGINGVALEPAEELQRSGTGR
ncbi:MAG: iron-containing redox enzyme family protein [Pseudomonadota bacterium]